MENAETLSVDYRIFVLAGHIGRDNYSALGISMELRDHAKIIFDMTQLKSISREAAEQFYHELTEARQKRKDIRIRGPLQNLSATEELFRRFEQQRKPHFSPRQKLCIVSGTRLWLYRVAFISIGIGIVVLAAWGVVDTGYEQEIEQRMNQLQELRQKAALVIDRGKRVLQEEGREFNEKNVERRSK